MHLSRLTPPLSLVTPIATVAALCCWITLIAGQESSDLATLKPLNIDDFEAATGIVRRAADGNGFDRIDPSNTSHLAFGAPLDDNGRMHVANMTLVAPDGSKLVTLERFEGLTSAIDCNGDDNQLSLTFKTQEAFDYATKVWSYVNDNDSNEFLLIANHDGCGPENQRQPYRVLNIENIKTNFTSLMETRPASWKEIAGTYQLDYGTVMLSQQGARRLRVRGVPKLFAPRSMPKDADYNTTFLNELEKRDWESPGLSIGGITVGTPHKLIGPFTDPTSFPPKYQIACTNCFIKSSFSVSLHIGTSGFEPVSASIMLTVDQFDAALEMWLALNRERDTNEVDEFHDKWAITPRPIPIPGLSWGIPLLVEFGFSVELYLHGEIQWFNRFNFTLGATAHVTKGAKIPIDLVDPTGKTHSTGLQGSNIDGYIHQTKNIAEMSLNSWISVLLSGGLRFFTFMSDPKELKAELDFRTPRVNLNFSTGYDEVLGYCGDEPSKKFGWSIYCDLNIQIWVKVTNPFKWGPKNFWRTRIWDGPRWNLINICHSTNDPLPGIMPPYQPGPHSPGQSPPAEPPPPSGTQPPGIPSSGIPTASKPPGKGISCTVGNKKGTCRSTSQGCNGGYFEHGTGPPWPCEGGDDVQCCIPGQKPTSTPASCHVGGKNGTCLRKDQGCNGGYFEFGTGPPWPCEGGDDIRCCIKGTMPSSTPTGCTIANRTGTCMDADTQTCEGGNFVPGQAPPWPCPGGNNVQCCVKGEKPTPTPVGCTIRNNTGICLNKATYECEGGYFEPGTAPPWPCPGDDNVQCCIQGQKPTPTPTGCTIGNNTGVCLDRDTQDCKDGYFVPGQTPPWPCPGGNNIQCCITESCTAGNKTGVCLNSKAKECTGGRFVPGTAPPYPCPGGNDIQCCVR